MSIPEGRYPRADPRYSTALGFLVGLRTSDMHQSGAVVTEFDVVDGEVSAISDIRRSASLMMAIRAASRRSLTVPDRSIVRDRASTRSQPDTGYLASAAADRGSRISPHGLVAEGPKGSAGRDDSARILYHI